MSTITEHRHLLRDAVTPLLGDDESVTVTAAPSEYTGNLDRLRFYVIVSVGEGEEAGERLDELLDPAGGVKAALEDAGAVVSKSSGHQLHPGNEVGSTWTAELIT